MAAKVGDQSKLIARLCDFTSEPKRMLPPIKGYEKGPIVTIDQAIEPLIPLVPDLEEMIWTVKENCQNPQDHLSSDESASIMLYTLEWMPRENSFYFILNQALRSQNRQQLLPWFPFLRLFMFALTKLPSAAHRILYRGIQMDLSEDFPKGKKFVWWAFSSCSSSIEVLEQFLSQSGPRTIFNIECDSAKEVYQHSFYESENELLMYPARQFQVVSSFNSGNQLKIIHLKEIEPPFPLIHIPQTTSSISNQIPEIQPSFSHMHISHTSSIESATASEAQEPSEISSGKEKNLKLIILAIGEAISDKSINVLSSFGDLPKGVESEILKLFGID